MIKAKEMLISTLTLIIFLVTWAVTHSVLASLTVKNWTRRVFGLSAQRWYRLGYNIIAVVTLLPLSTMLGLLPDQTLYVVPAPWRWGMAAGQLLALVGVGTTLLHINLWHFLGLAQLFSDRPHESGSLVVRGFYCWIRHPLYFFSLAFLWLTPAMTANLLTTYVLFSFYFYVGSIYEERRLVAEFGQAYQAHQQRVPRLIPHLWRWRSCRKGVLVPDGSPHESAQQTSVPSRDRHADTQRRG
jgi:protein-S-isoprenylcysteine O-methyltransferase Ste14